MVVLKIISVALTSSAVITGWDSSLISWVLKGGGGRGGGGTDFFLVCACMSFPFADEDFRAWKKYS